MIRGLITLTGTVCGVSVGYYLGKDPAFFGQPLPIPGADPRTLPPSMLGENPEIALSIVLGMFGYLLGSMLAREIEIFLDEQIKAVDFRKAMTGTLGFIGGLLLANLIILLPVLIFVNTALFEVPEWLRAAIPILKIFGPLIINLLFGYIGLRLVLKYRTELAVWLGMAELPETVLPDLKVVDTSALVDGRIADVMKTRFLSGKMIVPRFVLNELQLLADSNDPTKRTRGRRGLDVLTKLREEFPRAIELSDADYPALRGVDEKLTEFARLQKCSLITTDFNLNKVAQIRGIEVLNVNDLANAVKPQVLPGEELVLHLMKPGKEAGQAVGYLADGTMVVVEDGMSAIGKTVETLVTSMTQTAAGRLIFTRLKSPGGGGGASGSAATGAPGTAENGADGPPSKIVKLHK